MSDNDVHDALASIDAARATAGDAFSRHSWSYDLIYSLLIGVFVATFALPFRIQPLAWAATGGLLALLAWGWARKHGVWISGVKPKRARWIAAVIGLVCAGLALATQVAASQGLPLFAAPAAVAAFIAALVCSRWWRAVYRTEMGLPL
jgi:hypothetical protein